MPTRMLAMHGDTASSAKRARSDPMSRRAQPTIPPNWEQNGGLRTHQVAAILHLPEDTARKIIKAHLPHYRVGRVIRVPGQALAAVLEQGGLQGDVLAP